jgi:SAM-dependent methyltransferase
MSLIAKIKKYTLIALRPVTRRLWPVPLSHLNPISRRWGFERGTPIGRTYVNRFIAENAKDLCGDILEIKSRLYSNVHASGTGKRDVLDIDESNHNANINADLSRADNVPSNSYDCVILTETLQFVHALEQAVQHCHRILKPGGILLVSVPCTAPIDNELAEYDFWRFTPNSCRKLFGDVFGRDNVDVKSYGNFATCIAGLSGAAFEELPNEIIDVIDPRFPHGVLIRARKQAANT